MKPFLILFIFLTAMCTLAFAEGSARAYNAAESAVQSTLALVMMIVTVGAAYWLGAQ